MSNKGGKARITKRELEEYRSVRREVIEERERLCSMRSAKSKRLAEELERKIARLDRQQVDVERFIAAIPDSLVRRIAVSRFIECRSWESVARKLGGYNTAEAVRKIWQRWARNNL